MFQITTVDHLIQKAGVKCLVYGGAGVGKTRLSLTCPYPMVFSAERGLLSLKGSGIHAAEINTLQDLKEAHDWALRSADANNYHTFIFDSMTDLAETILVNEKKAAGKDPRKAYGNMADEIMQVFRNFRDYSMKHVVFIAQEERDKDENGMMMYQPSMPGQQVGRKSPYIVDECFRLYQHKDMQTQQQWGVLRTRISATEVAKDRSGKLAELEPPDMNYIFNKILA
jgi:hypothetical protein